MFEIAPFTCFSEFVDLEDFLIRHSNIAKFRKLGNGDGAGEQVAQTNYARDKQKAFDKTAELLYATKLAEIRKEVNLLQRNFNVVGHTARTVEDASRELCIFSPAIANIQEVCLILNPIYNNRLEAAFEVLVRANFMILQHTTRELEEQYWFDLFQHKLGAALDLAPVLDNLRGAPVHIFHLAKIAADREIRAMYQQSDLQFEDLYCVTNWPAPFKPMQIPHLFFFMDTERTFELCLRLLYKSHQVQYTGEDFIEKIPQREVANIVQGCLLVTVGDKLKKLMIDGKGNVRQQSKVEAETIDRFEPVNRPMHLEKNEGLRDGCIIEPQFMLQVGKAASKISSVHYVAEADEHGLFEIRFHRLAHCGDRENSDTFPSKQILVDQVSESENRDQIVANEAMCLFERFASCSYYYNEVNKQSYNVCPAFYKFKIAPFQWLFDQIEGRDGDQIDERDEESSVFSDDEDGLRAELIRNNTLR